MNDIINFFIMLHQNDSTAKLEGYKILISTPAFIIYAVICVAIYILKKGKSRHKKSGKH